MKSTLVAAVMSFLCRFRMANYNCCRHCLFKRSTVEKSIELDGTLRGTYALPFFFFFNQVTRIRIVTNEMSALKKDDLVLVLVKDIGDYVLN